MQAEITTEQDKDDDMNAKFTCYCTTNDGELSDSLAELRARIPQLEAEIESAVSLKAQLENDLVAHKQSREDAKQAIGDATKQREKQADEFGAASTELKTNVASCKSAVTALTKGLQGSFLQTPAALSLRKLVMTRETLGSYQRETLASFLSTTSTYVPVSQEVIGILAQLQEDMEKELAEITKVENDALTQFEGLVSAKENEIEAATQAIEAKTERAGETAVQIVSLKNDLEDTKDSLGADEVFLMELKKNCKNQAGEYDARKQARAEELVAVSETIKILNDDDALDLFKKTLASPALLQMNRERDVRAKAVAALQKSNNKQLNLITLALKGKKVGFEKVLKMIDEMVAVLEQEQKDDDTHRDWCNTEFDSNEDTRNGLKRRIAGLETKVTETEEAIASAVDDIANLRKSIKELDKAVDEATGNRKEENKAFVEEAAQNNAALQLLGVAKNRLNKFYNPAVYKEPKQRELTEEEQIFVNSGGADPRIAEAGFIQLRAVRRAGAAPAPAPETMEAYSKKDSGGPLALLDRLANDLQRDMRDNEHEEQEAQKDYEEFMSDSVAKRTADSRALTEQEAQKAELEADLQGAKEIKKNKAAELVAAQEYKSQLHGSCDFLVQNYDLRKTARANERDALNNAKAVLSGADFSFQQVHASKSKFLAK